MHSNTTNLVLFAFERECNSRPMGQGEALIGTLQKRIRWVMGSFVGPPGGFWALHHRLSAAPACEKRATYACGAPVRRKGQNT
jgi:hypothetical protein